MRDVFHGNTTMSRMANDLEKLSTIMYPITLFIRYWPQKYCIFDYAAVLRHSVISIGMFDKVECGSVCMCSTLDFAEVCSTTKIWHVLTGLKTIDKNARHSRTKN